MQTGQKRKRRQTGQSLLPQTKLSKHPSTVHLKAKDSVKNQFISVEPYPLHPSPTPEDCFAVRDELLKLHGFPEEFAKYRRRREDTRRKILNSENGLVDERVEPEVLVLERGSNGSSDELGVLEGLVTTVLSQNTTEGNSQKAFKNLKAAFPTWEDVLGAEQKMIENAIRCGGLAPTKASCIKKMLNSLMERKGTLSLEYLHDMSVDQIKAELSSFKGIGPKTVACVLMFQLQKDDFPVDTHIFQIAKTLAWVPASADTKKTYLHLNQRIPDELKFDLNCLLYTHGKLCRGCSVRAGKQERKESIKQSCPLLRFCRES